VIRDNASELLENERVTVQNQRKRAFNGFSWVGMALVRSCAPVAASVQG